MTHAIHDIPVTSIDPSPYQHRKHFSRDALQELAKSIERDGLVEPIVVRPLPDGYELIAGERRVRAVKEYTTLDTILARIVDVTDLQARRMCATENMQREDLSAVEMVGAIVELIDAELIDDEEYASKAVWPKDRVKWVLGRLDSVRASKDRGSELREEAAKLFHKFVEQIEKIFTALPKPMQWRAFYNHDLPLVTELDPTVMEWAIANKLNKSQTKALNDMKRHAPDVFQELAQQADEDGRITITDTETGDSEELRDHSAKELRTLTERYRDAPTLTRPLYEPDRPLAPISPTIIHGKAEHCPGIADDTIDLIITSPPYNLGGGNWPMGGQGRTPREDGIGYSDTLPEDAYQAWQIRVCIEMYRVAKPGASFFYNHKVRQKDGAMIHPLDWLRHTDNPWIIRQEIIWDRRSTHNHSATLFWPEDERIYWMTKGKPTLPDRPMGFSSVWEFNAPVPGTWHPAPFPEDIPQRCLQAIGRQGITVLDPFMGSGTTLRTALAHGYKAIGIEVNEDYIAQAKKVHGWI